MKTNLSSQITLDRVSPRYYRPGGNIERSVLTRFEKLPTDIYATAEEALSKGTWGHSVDITADVTDVNTIIWVKYDASNATEPINDDTTAVCLKATIEAV